jgi:3-oxoacyl-[acyl-carrier-protein] synthase II
MLEKKLNARIVVTGMGLISPLGHTVKESWAAAKAGTSGIDWITLYDHSELDMKIAGEVKNFDPVALFGAKEVRRTDRSQQFALVAAREALQDSGLSIDGENAFDVGVVVGSGIGGISTLVNVLGEYFERGPRGVSPTQVPQILHDSIAAKLSIELGLRGPNFDITTACATGNNTLGEAADMIRMGRARAMLAGASEACIIPMVLAGFHNMKVLAPTPTDGIPAHAARPFDLNRKGFACGEGAGVLVLETLEDAVARGAHIYAEITGYGHTSDAYHVTAPREDGTGAARSMTLALKDAELKPEDIDYVNAHGTGTYFNDKSETLAMKLALGESAYNVPISSTKSMTGHMMGAAGAAETIFSIMAIQDNFVPPTINLVTPDPECDLNYTPNVGKEHQVDRVLNYTAGFGGHNVSLIIERYTENGK